MLRWWQNETGTIHLVASSRPAPGGLFERIITTECGLEYKANSSTWDYDPSRPVHEQTNTPFPEAARCGRCPWDEVMG